MEYNKLVRIASAMKKERAMRGMTQEQAAEFIGMSASFYIKIEGCFQAPGMDMLIRICNAYGLSLDSLLLGKNTEVAHLDSLLQGLDPEQMRTFGGFIDRLIVMLQNRET